MSEFTGRVGCPNCGALASAELQDWATYISIVCHPCGYKFGELVPAPVVTSPEVPEMAEEVHEVARSMGLSVQHAVVDVSLGMSGHVTRVPGMYDGPCGHRHNKNFNCGRTGCWGP